MQKTCFVIIGFGKKTDYQTGRVIDLDKTFDYIIKPVFEDLGFLCFRASDIKHAGVIDVPMYESILKSDFVIADLSTLNPNVLYELGIRHSVKKNTTIIISEKELKYPFDLSHILIEPYEHLGTAIDFGEVQRFREILKLKVIELSKNPKVDSPLYSLFPNLNVPKFTEQQIEEIKESVKDSSNTSLTSLIEIAEGAKNRKEYDVAIKMLETAKELSRDNTLVIQRLALVTYKSEKPTPSEALLKAEQILKELNPSKTTDLETLGLSGAINKRLFEVLNKEEFLDKALWFYEKGFYIGEDYYNGINLAYLFNIKATSENNKFLAFANYGNAIRIRKKIIDICINIMEHKSWKERDDKEWVSLTLAEAYFGIGDVENERKALLEAQSFLSEFGKDSYSRQHVKLKDLIENFNSKFQ
jgi:tetratricopeptide (TPR) repeat protein